MAAKEILAMTSPLPLVRVICLACNKLEFLHQLFNTTFSQDYNSCEVNIDGGSIDCTNICDSKAKPLAVAKNHQPKGFSG
jgi:hypothetical protein|tara:strand:+ start:473 stop:712 length:240 start_codon:yes stop_codon:yes gene_type:complete